MGNIMKIPNKECSFHDIFIVTQYRNTRGTFKPIIYATLMVWPSQLLKLGGKSKSVANQNQM